MSLPQWNLKKLFTWISRTTKQKRSKKSKIEIHKNLMTKIAETSMPVTKNLEEVNASTKKVEEVFKKT